VGSGGKAPLGSEKAPPGSGKAPKGSAGLRGRLRAPERLQRLRWAPERLRPAPGRLQKAPPGSGEGSGLRKGSGV